MNKKIETSKIIFFIIIALTIFTIGLSTFFMIKHDTEEPLAYIVPSVFVELGATTGVYYWKSKSENKIKMTLSAVKELSQIDDLTEEQTRIVEALVSTLN